MGKQTKRHIGLHVWLFKSALTVALLCTAVDGRTIYVDDDGCANLSNIRSESDENVYEPYPAVSNELLSQYTADYEDFEGVQIADKIVYFRQRRIEQAIVQKDFVVYHFDKDTKELLDLRINWRDDLPERLPKIVSKENAESMVEGRIRFSQLFYISPESEVFPIEPIPENPCWVVEAVEDGRVMVTVIDAVEGKVAGHGIPPPYNAFSLTGPTNTTECTGGWYSWYTNARNWFNTMGYVTDAVVWPTEAQVKSHIQSHYTALFYELAHGGSTSFSNACDDSTRASEIETWIADYHKMPFAFIGSCGGMCSTDDGTLSYEFRKGSNEFTATVGYCGMSDSPCVDDCWNAGYTISWQSALFGYINEGRSVREAFDLANADYPGCGANECMRFAGDENFALVPVVDREICKIQRAIDAAADGDTVVVAEGVYDENISFKGKKIRVRSTDPNNEAVVTATVIRGSGDEPVVTFSESEDSKCVLAGFFITDGNTGIYCSDASPTIVSCIITANSGDGLRSCNGSNPRMTNCLIAANEGAGVGAFASGSAEINNCTIVTNQLHGVYQGIPTVTNSIIYFNRLGIDSPLSTITYSNVEGSWPGEGNIDEDPLLGNAFHLKSQAGRWIPSIGVWFLDGETSPCVDAGNPGCSLGNEPEDGKNVRINMGAYGGTAKASKTPDDWRSVADFNNDWIVDFNDVTAFVGYWLDEGECVPGDLNRNKSVDFADFGIFGENWRWER